MPILLAELREKVEYREVKVESFAAKVEAFHGKVEQPVSKVENEKFISRVAGESRKK